MRIKRFAVSGFKNFTQEVVLDDLGEICVIHGENNVGKSNLLEAMLLFFKILQYGKIYEMGDSKHRIFNNLNDLGFEPSQIFNLASPLPIELHATVLITPKEMKEFGKLHLASDEPNCENSEYEVSIYVKIADTVALKIVNPMENWFTEPDQMVISPEKLNAIMLRAIAEKDYQPVNLALNDRFILIGTHRMVFSDNTVEMAMNRDDYTDYEESAQKSANEIVPQSLRLQLYGASVSFDLAILKRWKLFVKIMSRFNDILGEGQFIARYDPSKKIADVVFDTDDKRIPLDLLGSGIQQVVALIARLLVSNATFVAIEEPELNLRYTLQLRLYEVFKEIVADPAGANQIFLTSHSPAFEHGEHFYHMHTSEHGITVEKRPISLAPMVTGMSVDTVAINKNASYGYVSTEGLIRIPERIRKELGTEEGGGVVFLKRKDNGHVELLTNQQFANLFESSEDE